MALTSSSISLLISVLKNNNKIDKSKQLSNFLLLNSILSEPVTPTGAENVSYDAISDEEIITTVVFLSCSYIQFILKGPK